MKKLNELLSKCKCGVHLIVNQHRDYYQTAEERIGEFYSLGCDPDIADEVRSKMVENDYIIELQFYPDTPIGSYTVYHYDIDLALEEALTCFDS